MRPDELTTLLQALREEGGERSPQCPDEERIAGFVDGSLDETSTRSVRSHLADCGRCLAIVGMIAGERDEEGAKALDATMLARASASRPTKSSEKAWWQAPQWAAAAVLLLAVPVLIQTLHTDRTASYSPPEAIVPAQRSSGTSSVPNAIPSLIFPSAGAVVEASQLTIRWTEVPGSSYYDVRILTDSGELVARQRVSTTEWRPPERLQLDASNEYFVHVDAYTAGGKAASSTHVPFRVLD